MMKHVKIDTHTSIGATTFHNITKRNNQKSGIIEKRKIKMTLEKREQKGTTIVPYFFLVHAYL